MDASRLYRERKKNAGVAWDGDDAAIYRRYIDTITTAMENQMDKLEIEMDTEVM